MRYMNDYDIERASRQYRDHPILGPAVQTLKNLVSWTNSHSDGWAYWPKPARAAASLMELIDRGSSRYGDKSEDVTLAEYKKALVPIKAFRTRQKADFVVCDGSTPVQPSPPQVHSFAVAVTGCTEEQARQVMAERIGHDEDYGFAYQIDWA